MTLNQYLMALKALSLKPSRQETSKTLGLSVRHLIRIANDQAPVPDPIDRLLRALLRLKR